VGSYWQLSAGGLDLLYGKNYVPDELMLIFTDADRVLNGEALASLRESDDDAEIVVDAPTSGIFAYKSTVADIKARLSLQGFSTDAVRRNAISYLAAELSDPERWVPDEWEQLARELGSGLEHLNAVVKHRRSHPYRRLPTDESPLEVYLNHWWEDLCEAFDDPRFRLSLLLGPALGTTQVTLDLTDPLLGGYLEADELLHLSARRRRERETAASGQIIVVTEGSSDSFLLRRALELAEPGIASYFSFLDFAGYSAPGGTDRVVSLTRGLAAAQVMNRVIAVLDNDTAGHQALRILQSTGLPDRIRFYSLPDMEYAREFPTLGPGGFANLDVNGRALSIEMMFGLAVLRDANGGSMPHVRWSSYNGALGQYQGAIENKISIQDQLYRLLKASTLAALPPEMADGCRRLARFLVQSAAQATPTMASESSPLLSARSRQANEASA
jgi:hypothetical protein